MNQRPKITAIELIQFSHELQDVGREPTIGIPIYKPGSTLQSGGNAIKIHTDIGVTGEFYGAPIYEILGGSQKKLKCYASTYIGDREPDGLSTPEAYADFAQQCQEIGYQAFKIHGCSGCAIFICEVDSLRVGSGLS